MQELRRAIEEPHPLDEHVVWFVIVSYLCLLLRSCDTHIKRRIDIKHHVLESKIM